METIKYKGHTIVLSYDNTCPSPRGDMEEFGTMVCFHKKYKLGDSTDLKSSDFSGWEDLKKYLINKEGAGVVLPLYLMDHSGISMSTASFGCPWDSVQVGYIYASRAKILAEFGGKALTKKLKEKAEGYLKGEVEVYDLFISGECYGFVVDPEDMDSIYDGNYDSCGGFYGREPALQEAQLSIDSLIEKEAEEKLLLELPVSELPLYVNHEWKYKGNREAYLDRLRATGHEVPAEDLKQEETS